MSVRHPLVSDPAVRQCLWMTFARCGFMIRPDEPSHWLHPAASGETADVVVELLAGKLRMKAALR